MPNPTISLYGESEFKTFCLGMDQHNRLTLLRFWNMAKIKRILLLLRRISPRMMNCLLLTPGEINSGKIIPRFKVGTIFTGKITDNDFHVFGTDAIIGPLKAAFENGHPINSEKPTKLPVDDKIDSLKFEPRTNEIKASPKPIKSKKPRGRPKKVVK